MGGSVRFDGAMGIGRIGRLGFVLIWIAAGSCAVSAQNGATITIRLIDSQTGQAIVPMAGDNGISVTVNEESASPHLMARVNKDGAWELHVGADVAKVQVDTPAGPGGFGYVFCDCSKFHPSMLPSYPVADILKSGVVAPNKCSKKTTVAKPGEMVFFVRRPNWHEKLPI